MPSNHTAHRPDPAAERTDLRIVWVSPSYGYRGDMMYFRGLFERFCQRFPATRIFYYPNAAYDTGGLPLVPDLIGWAIRRDRQVGGASYDAAVHVPSPGFLARLKAARPQVAITIEFTLAALATIALSRLGRGFAVVLLVEGDPAARGGSGNRLVLALKRWACRHADVIQTSNASGRRFLVETLGADPAKIRVAPYLTSCPPRPAAAPARDPERLHILFANSLTPRKGAAALLQALAMLKPEIARRVRLTVVGDGPERAALEAVAARLAGPVVSFVGAQPYAKLGEFLAAADVLAVPSHADYRSLAGFEGLAYGLALLASRHDGASKETLAGETTGFEIDPAEPDTIAAAITRLVDDEELLAAFKASSVKLFVSRFSYDRIVDELANSVFTAIMAQESTRSR